MIGCIYRDARSIQYYMLTDFQNNIVVKQNVGEKLDKCLSRAYTLLPDVVGLGDNTTSFGSLVAASIDSGGRLLAIWRHYVAA